MYNLNLNIQQFTGRLTRDPELLETSTGKLLLKFSIAYQTFSSADAAGSKVSFLPVETWEKAAAFYASRLKKGMQIVVRGELVQNRWHDAAGKTRSQHKLVARTIGITDLYRRPEPGDEYPEEAA